MVRQGATCLTLPRLRYVQIKATFDTLRRQMEEQEARLMNGVEEVVATSRRMVDEQNANVQNLETRSTARLLAACARVVQCRYLSPTAHRVADKQARLWSPGHEQRRADR